jgi:hypothetical protein
MHGRIANLRQNSHRSVLLPHTLYMAIIVYIPTVNNTANYALGHCTALISMALGVILNCKYLESVLFIVPIRDVHGALVFRLSGQCS